MPDCNNDHSMITMQCLLPELNSTHVVLDCQHVLFVSFISEFAFSLLLHFLSQRVKDDELLLDDHRGARRATAAGIEHSGHRLDVYFAGARYVWNGVHRYARSDERDVSEQKAIFDSN